MNGPTAALFRVKIEVPGEYNARRLSVVAADGDEAVAMARAGEPSARLLSLEFVELVDMIAPAATASATEPSNTPGEQAQATNTTWAGGRA